MKKRKLFQSFKYAMEGIVYGFRTQRNMRLHTLALAVLIFMMIRVSMSIEDVCLILFAAMVVMVSEMINTAIEKTIDLYTENLHPLAKTAKDVAAGAVLLSATFAIVVGGLIFSKYLL